MVVVDFNNDFKTRPDGAKTYTELLHPIPQIETDSLVVHAADARGRPQPIIAVEKKINGKIFMKDIYTTINVSWEMVDPMEARVISKFSSVLKRFIGAYRYIHPDVRAPIEVYLEDIEMPLKVANYFYNPYERSLPLERRILYAYTEKFSPLVFSIRQAARGLQDIESNSEEIGKIAERVGSYLFNGFELSENLFALEKIVDSAFIHKQYRSAVVEAMSIFEIAIYEERQKYMIILRKSPNFKIKIDAAWKYLVNSILPSILDLYSEDKSDLMAWANRTLQLRNAIVHKGYMPTAEETDMALSFVRTLLAIFDIPEQFRANWKIKSGVMEAMKQK
ncbi:hypothetical protein STVA_32210 [Allostella vacuolata]|nr:hypothetical protein STVA_32210 [Stella vacuolata]